MATGGGAREAHAEWAERDGIFDCACLRAQSFLPPAAVEISSGAGGRARALEWRAWYSFGIGIGIGIGVDVIRPVLFQLTYSMAARKTSSLSGPNAMPMTITTPIPIPMPTPILCCSALVLACNFRPPPCTPLSPRRLTTIDDDQPPGFDGVDHYSPPLPTHHHRPPLSTPVDPLSTLGSIVVDGGRWGSMGVVPRCRRHSCRRGALAGRNACPDAAGRRIHPCSALPGIPLVFTAAGGGKKARAGTRFQKRWGSPSAPLR